MLTTRADLYASRFSTAVLCMLLLGSLQSLAQAAWPPDESKGTVDYSSPASWPNDPGYAGEWQLWSFAPSSSSKLDARTKRLGIGAHVDRAWAKTAGDPRVLIAVLDSGAYWDRPDLVNKWFLNAGELPPPDDACQTPEHRGPGKRIHDANGDGVFNVQDYTTARGHEQPLPAKLCDPRLRDANNNRLLDPQDLLLTFSDRKDDDGNGYIDDIAGWDFFHNDNDAYDDTRYGHGTGEATDSAAEADNGIDDAGVCPRCRVTPLRVGDSFVADANSFAVAAAYAVDLGASVIQEALGTISNTPLSKWAIDYAYDNHVTVIASAADENSFHHNFPGTNNHTVYVHAIRYNAQRREDATHAFAFDNCTNYGAQLQLSVPGTSCSSEATGRAAGMAGLLYSAALQANLPALPRLHGKTSDEAPAGDDGPLSQRVRRLTAEEVRQLFIGTVDSFYDPADSANPAAYPTGPGFVRRFGYGRTNARSAVDAITSGRLPPQVDIESPEWFQVLSPAAGKVRISGRIALRYPGSGSVPKPGQDTFDYTVEWAPGVDPSEADWHLIGRGDQLSMAMEGPLADLPVASIKVKNVVPPRDDPSWQPDDASHIYTISVRVRATQHSLEPARDRVVGEARRAVHVHDDPDLLPGFPKNLGASGEASLKTADLDGDGKREVIVADAGGLIHALRSDGSELPGWPAQTPALPALTADGNGHLQAPAFSRPSTRPRPGYGQAVMATPAIGDVTGDGKPEVVVATFDGSVVILAASGQHVPGSPLQLDRQTASLTSPRRILADGVFAAPVLYDLDKDGTLDVIVAAMDGQVYVFRGGTLARMPGWPLLVQDPQRPDKDGDPQPQQRARLMSTPAVGDLNGDGQPDLVLASNEQYGEYGRLYALDGRGSRAPSPILPGWPISIASREVLPVVGVGIPNAPALADLDGDGRPEVFINGIGGALEVYRGDGQPYSASLGRNRQAYGSSSNAQEFATLGFIASPALGDLDGDGQLEAVLPTVGANALLSMLKQWERLDFEMHLSAWDLKSGKQKVGFPRTIEDYTFFVNPIIVDIDGDGKKEVIAGSAGYFLHAWNESGKEPAGFPKLAGGWLAATPAVGDTDGDGRLELFASTRNGWLFGWKTRGFAKGRMDWDSFHHDTRNTGNMQTPLGQGGDQIEAPEPEPMTNPIADGGCACSLGRRSALASGSSSEGRSSDSPPGAAATVFALLLLTYYARRRRHLLD
jgi:hypothetical protein